MYPKLHQRSLRALEEMSPGELDSVLARAKALKRAAENGNSKHLLRGKNVGLLCETQESKDARDFHRAASDLGAHVAHLRPSLALLTPHDVRHTAQMLGRLYDAVECQGLSSALIAQLECDAGVPVFDGLGTSGNTASRLADLLDGDGSPQDKRHYVLQALLLGTIT